MAVSRDKQFHCLIFLWTKLYLMLVFFSEGRRWDLGFVYLATGVSSSERSTSTRPFMIFWSIMSQLTCVSGNWGEFIREIYCSKAVHDLLEHNESVVLCIW